MANPLYGQNKADALVDNAMYLLVGPTVSFAAADIADGDVIGSVNIPAGTFVHKVQIESIAAATGGTAADLDIDVGDSGDADLYLADVDGAADSSGLGTANTIVGLPAGANTLGKYYSSDDVISITVNTESSTAGTARVLIQCSTPIVP
jgi:hypothetical protein